MPVSADKPSENEINRKARCLGDHPHINVMDQLERHRIVLQELDFKAMKVLLCVWLYVALSSALYGCVCGSLSL